MTDLNWIKGKVITGEKLGRTIGFPTANLNPSLWPGGKRGVYACLVELDKIYAGALYFGPKLVLDETIDVLEIHILDFNRDIYNKELMFAVTAYIRPPRDFINLHLLKLALEDDVKQVRNSLKHSNTSKKTTLFL